MQIQSIHSTNFGKIYYGSEPESLTRTQKDVLQDINDVLEEHNYVKKLENINYDVYIEPNSNGYAMDVAFFKNFSVTKNSKIKYDKVIKMGSYISAAMLKYLNKGQDCYSSETINNRFYKFFKNEAYGKYKKFLNYL